MHRSTGIIGGTLRRYQCRWRDEKSLDVTVPPSATIAHHGNLPADDERRRR